MNVERNPVSDLKPVVFDQHFLNYVNISDITKMIIRLRPVLLVKWVLCD